MPDHTTEPLNVTLQVMLTPSARERLHAAALREQRRPSALARFIVMQWLDLHEPASKL
jgi:DNA-binding TFAR19-related protein (PDSD5 family)